MKPCPVLKEPCEHYSYQEDRNGDVAICFCSHEDNPDKYEGNCVVSKCPVVLVVGNDPPRKITEIHGEVLLYSGINPPSNKDVKLFDFLTSGKDKPEKPWRRKQYFGKYKR